MTKKMKMKTGIIIAVIGVIGFFAGTALKGENKLLEEKLSGSGLKTMPVAVDAGANYTIFFYGISERGLSSPGFANLDVSVAVKQENGASLFQKRIVASASNSEEKGGVKRAQNSAQYHGNADKTENWLIQVQIADGDEVSVEVYKDLGDFLNIMPGLSVLLLVAGVVFILKARAVGE